MGLKFEGLDEFRKAFERIRHDGKDTLSKAVYEHMRDRVYPEAQIKVPVLTGALKGTGRIMRGDKPGSWQIRYGDSPVEDDSAVDYAAAVHQILTHHHAAPTQAKFLEEPLKDSVESLKVHAAKKLDELAQGV